MMLINVPSLMAILITMPPGLYNAINIAQWSATVASGEATKCCHWTSVHAILSQWPPWSSLLEWENTHHTTNILLSNYCTFFTSCLWGVCNKKRTWYGAHVGGSKINAIHLIIRLFLYHLLHMMSSWRHESIHNSTNNQQTPPPWWWSHSPL